jgi:hypothetical protein
MPDRKRKEKKREQNEQSAGQEARPETSPSRTHESGYGGRAGEPKTSSDEREPIEPTGKEPA